QEPGSLALLRVRVGDLDLHECQQQTSHPDRHDPPRRAHRPPPRSSTNRCTVQNAPREPTVYPGTASTQRGHRTSRMWKDRSSARISAMKPSWPSSTPTLKVTRANGRSWRGKPASVSALAKPKPWSSPNAKATTHGRRMVKLVSPRQERTISGPRKRMLSAI